MWVYSMFFYGEDAVATKPLLHPKEAAPKRSKYFLATQQVDEARHLRLLLSPFKEAIGVEGGIATGLRPPAGRRWAQGLPECLRAAEQMVEAPTPTAPCQVRYRRSRST